jgi:hypothetical protein
MGRKKKQSEEYRLLPDGQISMRCGVPMPRKYLRPNQERVDKLVANMVDYAIKCQNEYVIKELSDMIREPNFDKAMEHFQNVSDMNAYFERLLAIVNPSVYEEISKENGNPDQ